MSYFFVVKKMMVRKLSSQKENTTDNNADGVSRSLELTTTAVPKGSRVIGFTLRDGTKLNTFFELANAGDQEMLKKH